MSKTQERLETCSKAVTNACRSLVRQVQSIIEKKQKDGDEDVDYSKLSGHDFKVRQMEQQVSAYFWIMMLWVCLLTCCVVGRDFAVGEFTVGGETSVGRDAEVVVSGGGLEGVVVVVYIRKNLIRAVTQAFPAVCAHCCLCIFAPRHSDRPLLALL
jgi:hypothetical protein